MLELAANQEPGTSENTCLFHFEVLHFYRVLPGIHSHPAAVPQIQWRLLCWPQRCRLAADPRSPPSDSPSRGSQTSPARCMQSGAIWKPEEMARINGQVEPWRKLQWKCSSRSISCLQISLQPGGISDAKSCFTALKKKKKNEQSISACEPETVKDWFPKLLWSVKSWRRVLHKHLTPFKASQGQVHWLSS